MKRTMIALALVLLPAMAGAQEQSHEPLDAQKCISYMERSLNDAYMLVSGFNASQPDWRGIRNDATRCGAWHSEHIEDARKRELFAKAYATFLSGIAAPSMNVVGTFSYDSLAYTTAR